jgi:uncharacterized protein
MRITSILISLALTMIPAAPVLAQAVLPVAAPIPVSPVRLSWNNMVNLHISAQFGGVREQSELGQVYVGDQGIPADPVLAQAWLSAAANQGYANAQLWLGLLYRFPAYGVPQDYAVAAGWFRKAADQGDSDAQNFLGRLYRDGQGVPKDDVQAFMWLDLAVAGQGDSFNTASYTEARDAIAATMTPARLAKARALVKAWKPLPLTLDQQVTAASGLADTGKAQEALTVLTPLAEGGHRQAQFLVGNLYRGGNGVTQDLAAAMRWYTKAAEQGHPMAQTFIGLMYLNGRGVTADAPLAAQWLSKAATQGVAYAQFHYSELLLGANGVTADPVASRAMLRRAANQGHGEAQYRLGAAIALGEGTPVDKVEAYMWLTLADTYGNATLRPLTLTVQQNNRKGMTAANIAEGERRAKAWTPTLAKP